MKLSASFIYGLLVCILLVGAPHVDHLPLWVGLLAGALLSWRAYLAYSGTPLPPHWLLLMLTVGSVGAILISFHTLFGREVGVTLLILLASLKLLELRAKRDATLMLYLCCFIIITNFFYSQSIPTALLMAASLLAILTTWLNLQAGTLTLQPRLRLAGILLGQAVPLALILFILFPRVQGPLWGLPQDAYAQSGLSDNMSPGSISKLSLSEAVAFRVKFNGKPPSRDRMYWRGPVLWEFDGRTWTQGSFLRAKPAQLDKLSDPVDYTVTLEPHNKTWLFTLEMPTQISIPATMDTDFQVLNKSNVTARIRYDLRSQLTYQANVTEDSTQLRRALFFPRQLNPRTQQLAAEWRASFADDAAVMRAALAYFGSQGFVYTLEPPPLGLNSVDDFLFKTRKGFCEHYASSFVILMRAAGIPARVVTGYQGASYNELGGYHIVRQSDAHAWAEVWLRERGWVRVDPTAAIAPERVQNGVAAAVSASASDTAALPFLATTQATWLINLRLNFDILNYQWNQWVLGYNPERQFAFLTRLGMEDITWQKMALSMMGGVAFLIGVFTLIMLYRLTRRDTDAAQRLYLQFCRKLEKVGVRRDAHEGPQDFAARAAVLKPQVATDIVDITSLYVALRYQAQDDAYTLQALQHKVRAFKL